MTWDMYYDRQGVPMDRNAYASAKYQDDGYKIVQQDTVSGFFVSTVWLGIDHRIGNGPPLIFETMVFDQRDDAESWSDVYCERYTTEDAARAGHDQALAWVRDKLAQEVS